MIYKEPLPDGEHVRVTFELPSSLWAERVNLVGDFNDWDTSQGRDDAVASERQLAHHPRACRRATSTSSATWSTAATGTTTGTRTSTSRTSTGRTTRSSMT